MGAEEAIYRSSNLYRIFQAKGSLFDGTLERPIMAPKEQYIIFLCRNSQAKIQRI